MLKRIILALLLANLLQPCFSQKETYLLGGHEAKLISLLLEDTINNTCLTVSNSFNWGLPNELFTNSNILKQGKSVLIQPLGTGRLYKAKKEKGRIYLERMDLTMHSGTNFYAQNFFIKDTLYQMGGIGFWQIRGILTYFSPQTKQWELVQTNKTVTTYFDDLKDAALHFVDDPKNPKLYVSNSYYYPKYPNSFETAPTDSCYAYDFITKNWTALGKLNPEFKKMIGLNRSHNMELHINELYIFQNQLEFYWVDFAANKLGKFSAFENTRMRDFWLSTYNNNKRSFEAGFQFNLGNDLYFMKLLANDSLVWSKINLNLNGLDLIKTIPIYNNTLSFSEYFISYYNQYKTGIFVTIFISMLFIGFGILLSRRKKMPKEVVTLLYQNFYNSINIVEKELIEVLYNNSLKGEEVPTKTINKIIGVQQKDTLTQNKSRSDHFIKINQKFKLATQNAEPLIIKNRDKADKRQYNYGLNNLYVTEIEKLIKA